MDLRMAVNYLPFISLASTHVPPEYRPKSPTTEPNPESPRQQNNESSTSPFEHVLLRQTMIFYFSRRRSRSRQRLLRRPCSSPGPAKKPNPDPPSSLLLSHSCSPLSCSSRPCASTVSSIRPRCASPTLRCIPSMTARHKSVIHLPDKRPLGADDSSFSHRYTFVFARPGRRR